MDTSDTIFTPFTPSVKFEEHVPIILFQSGYGSTSESHAPLLQSISDSGYVVVVPDRTGDKKGGKESVPQLFAALGEGKPASEFNAMSTDGRHLAAAFDWVKSRSEINGQKIDHKKIASAGFSMGCLEAIAFASGSHSSEVSACIIISSSSGTMLESFYAFSQVELINNVSNFSMPSLWITSNKDSQFEATKDLFEVAPSPASFLVFNDQALDLSMTLTDATSIWSLSVTEMMPGLAQHFALAAEEGVVSDVPTVAFLNRHLKDIEIKSLASPESVFEQKDK